MSPNTLGALLMMASMAAFTLNDTFIKLTDGQVPLMQLLVLRGALSSTLLVLLSPLLGRIRFDIARRDWGLIVLRSLAEVATAYFFLTALFHMPLANVTAIMQMLPLTVALAAALVLGEPLGWKRMAAILLGFMGMLLIVRPGAAGFGIWSVYVLLAVLCVTVRDLATRRLSPNVPSMTVALAAAVIVTLCYGAGSLAVDWVPIGPPMAALIVSSAVAIVGGYLLSVLVMRVGDIGFVAPFRYTSLVFALILGLAVFGDWPSTLTLVGAGIVVATGIFTLYRERRLARR